MKITGFIPNKEMAGRVIQWTYSFAGKNDEVEFLCYEADFDQGTRIAANNTLSEISKEAIVSAIQDPMIVKAIVERLRKSKSELLITSKFELLEIDGVNQNSDELIKSAPCQTFVDLFGKYNPSEVRKILVLSTGYVHDRATLRLLNKFKEGKNVAITVATIEDETSSKSEQTGELALKSLIHDIGLDEEDFEIKVVVDRLKHRGILKCVDGHNLVVAGMDAESYFHPLENSLGDTTVCILKRNPPLRLKSLIEWLPRINPADHADLVYELRQGSNWNPDFVVMLGLAAAVSSLGLIQDSPAVVIGSMLLAPLMTPMMGLGLALAQANTSFMKKSIKSIALGILLTLFISFILGLVIPSGETLSNEVLGRGTPNVLDLMIALFAAGAAAFAMARPNIMGAIAGVAIATALVPPACSVGISLAHGSYLNALGAGLLFFANLVAIIASSSFMFIILGISSARALKRKRFVARFGQIILVVILVFLFAPMSEQLLSAIKEGKNVPLTYPVTTAVSNAIQEKVDKDDGVEIIMMARARTQPGVFIYLASRKDLPQSYEEEIKDIVRQKMNDPDIPVRVLALRSIWQDSDSEIE